MGFFRRDRVQPTKQPAQTSAHEAVGRMEDAFREGRHDVVLAIRASLPDYGAGDDDEERFWLNGYAAMAMAALGRTRDPTFPMYAGPADHQHNRFDPNHEATVDAFNGVYERNDDAPLRRWSSVVASLPRPAAGHAVVRWSMFRYGPDARTAAAAARQTAFDHGWKHIGFNLRLANGPTLRWRDGVSEPGPVSDRRTAAGEWHVWHELTVAGEDPTAIVRDVVAKLQSPVPLLLTVRTGGQPDVRLEATPDV